MPTALFWMEARCDGRPLKLERKQSCWETGPGGFYTRSDVARRDTERAGWVYHKADKTWFCPSCTKAMKCT
jgi:hypothetical protein